MLATPLAEFARCDSEVYSRSRGFEAQRGRSPEVVEISWRAQRRLNARWRRLKGQRGKRNGIVAIAVARELAGFCWEIALAE